MSYTIRTRDIWSGESWEYGRVETLPEAEAVLAELYAGSPHLVRGYVEESVAVAYRGDARPRKHVVEDESGRRSHIADLPGEPRLCVASHAPYEHICHDTPEDGGA